jgi:hypothetical protein
MDRRVRGAAVAAANSIGRRNASADRRDVAAKLAAARCHLIRTPHGRLFAMMRILNAISIIFISIQ